MSELTARENSHRPRLGAPDPCRTGRPRATSGDQGARREFPGRGRKQYRSVASWVSTGQLTRVDVRIKDHGLDSIEVSDNGSGIAESDWAAIGAISRCTA